MTDKPVLLEILRTREFPFLGVIGSRAKAKRLRQDVAEAGLPEEAQQKFYCPVGLPLGTNHPQEIAVSVAAQLLHLLLGAFALADNRAGALQQPLAERSERDAAIRSDEKRRAQHRFEVL